MHWKWSPHILSNKPKYIDFIAHFIILRPAKYSVIADFLPNEKSQPRFHLLEQSTRMKLKQANMKRWNWHFKRFRFSHIFCDRAKKKRRIIHVPRKPDLRRQKCFLPLSCNCTRGKLVIILQLAVISKNFRSRGLLFLCFHCAIIFIAFPRFPLNTVHFIVQLHLQV